MFAVKTNKKILAVNQPLWFQSLNKHQTKAGQWTDRPFKWTQTVVLSNADSFKLFNAVCIQFYVIFSQEKSGNLIF